MERPDTRIRRGVVAAGLISLVAYGALHLLSPPRVIHYSEEMLAAARKMAHGLAIVGDYRRSAGLPVDAGLDPNGTGLIGPEYSELVTTSGDLEAKRTTTDPNMAALLVHLLEAAGAAGGDTVAIGCSASFPALLIASLAAAEAMGVHPVFIISLGSSSYGMSDPRFNLLHLHQLLLRSEITNVGSAAVSIGGSRDVGADLEVDARERLTRQIEATADVFIHEADLRINVDQRMRIYEGPQRSRVAAFINAGGNFANLGTSPGVLSVRPGLNRHLSLPAEQERGVLFEMAGRGVPVIHLLNIRGLADRYGLLWDPVPLPAPGTTRLTMPVSGSNSALWWISIIYILFLTLIGMYMYLSGVPTAIERQDGRGT